MAVLRQFPILVVLVLVAAGAMLLPALHAARIENWLVARTFLYHAVFFAMMAGILGLATMNHVARGAARYHLLSLLLAYVLLPMVLAAPLVALVPAVGLGGGYFEMLSSLTTTGATLFDRPRLLPETLHLWRALVGWMGGLMILVAAFAVLAPLNLGGFEIGQAGEGQRHDHSKGSVMQASQRLVRYTQLIAPVYVGLTGLLAMLLIFAGDRPFVAVCHAMAALSTSGISPIGGLATSQSGRLGEGFIALFLLLAVSHRIMSMAFRPGSGPGLRDPEVQLMLISVLGVTLLLFVRSFIGASEIDRQDNVAAALQAIWGSLFTVLSFLTTAGFESADWVTMQIWSNLPAPGTILLGVAVMGGGIATTAGGIKLLRLYALYRHGVREMDLLIHPSGMGPRGAGDTMISPGGARVAFIFLMLFLIAIALVMIALAATGLSFEHSLALAVAGLTNTGPAIRTLGDGTSYGDLSGLARGVLCLAMIVGRIEALVIIALFNPAYWRQ